jgi:hypothetical protein
MEAIARGYVLFARAHSSVFPLRFRGKRLDVIASGRFASLPYPWHDQIPEARE